MARPAIAALQEQQRIIQAQAEKIWSQEQAIGQLRSVATRQRSEITSLGRGLRAIADAAGIGDHVRTAMLKRADEQNPAQPIPEPPAEAPVQTTQEAQMPEAFGDVQAPGMVPGSTNDVAADTTTTNYTPGADIQAAPVKNLVDVTAPVDGTQGPRPLNEVRTLTDVRVGDPQNPAPAFPLRGEFANGPRLGSKEAASNRTMAALRLARLRMTAGVAQGDNDFEVATAIEKDAAMTTEAIEAEIQTLENVSKAASKRQERPSGLVPRAASQVHRTTPSLASTASTGGAPASDQDVEDADLFE